MKRLLIVTLFISSWVFQMKAEDFEMECEDGERVSQLSRPKGRGDKVGELKLKCSKIDPEPEKVECEWSEAPFQCKGKPEPCKKGEWLAGFRGYDLDERTGALLMHPKCCKSKNVKLKCSSAEKLNKGIRGKYKLKLAKDEMFGQFKCFRVYDDRRGYLWDFEMMASVCKFTSKGKKTSGAKDWTPIKNTLFKGKAKKTEKVKKLKGCKALCEKMNEKKSKSCGSINYRKGECKIFKSKPVNKCKKKTKKMKGWTLLYLGPQPKGSRCY